MRKELREWENLPAVNASCSSPGFRLANNDDRGKGIGIPSNRLDLGDRRYQVRRNIGTGTYNPIASFLPPDLDQTVVDAENETRVFETTRKTTTTETERTQTATSSSSSDIAESNRIPYQSDFTSFQESFGGTSEVSNVTYTSLLSTLPSDIVNITRRYRREGLDPCWRFSEGDPHKPEFYSPNYPSPYPKNISCFKVLEGELIFFSASENCIV
ncbi:hypothetical protein QAD02_004264 [Eretmocerus hayati]|uniref:Uncharacterized protein n=1 Tax=Eretmocerus hayati TaxID=131215 RepID=A0ACC2NQ58_9HYME|nr:hypothetical protein QAD02_004264 [Eretmocerus hayati]